MKTRISLIAILLWAVGLSAQIHIQLPDSGNWSTEALRPYLNKVVVFDMPMIVCSNANGNYVVSPWRRFQPESQPEANETSRINSTCMFSISNIPSPTTEMGEPSHRCGEKIYGLTAKVDKTSPSKLEWQTGGTWHGNTRADLEAGLPDLGNYRLLVCGFNLENYFMSLGSMGAKTEKDRQRQRTKVSKALKKINADIYGLVELQQGNEAVAEIVNDLNNNLPGRNYKYFRDATSGSMQKVEFVYDANKVEPIGTPAETNVELSYRKKMICFREIATGEKFVYSINHFKSMNTGGADRRENEARAVISLYNSYRQNRNVRDNDVLIMGDLNCYAFTSPIKIFTNNGMIDLHRAFHADSSYSYMYANMASYIDHAISNETLYRQVTGMAAYHINSDEDDQYTYDKSSDATMFRCSDHDPVLVGLKLDSTLSLPIKPYMNNGNLGKDSLTFYCLYTPSDQDPLVYFDIYTVNGFQVCPPTKMDYQGELFEEHTKYYTLSSTNTDLPDEVKQFLPLPPGIYVLHFYYKGTVTSHKLIVR